MERKLFDPKEPLVDRRRKEWVQLDQGWVSVWEMEFADTLFVSEHSLRPGASGPTVSGEAVVWQIMTCCHKGEDSDSPRTFDLTDLPRIQKLRAAEFQALMSALQQVNGLADEEVHALKDFTKAAPGTNRRR